MYHNFGKFSWDVCKLNLNKYISLVCPLVFLTYTLPGWAYMLTFEFLCSGINFDTSGLLTFWFSGGQRLRLLVLFILYLVFILVFKDFYCTNHVISDAIIK